jgi:Na+/citrate or Na+/malate symporter
MIKRELILPVLLFIGVVIAANMVISNHLIDKAVAAIPVPVVPKIVTVNLDRIVEDKLKEGMTPVQVVTFTDTLVQVLLSDGYIILDANAVINAADAYVLKNVSTEQLAKMVELKGIKIKDSKTFEEALSSSQKLYDDIINSTD